ncbi:MAG TPA: hypothetical protein VJ140_02020 [Actinomycetota bacterium]|nr:hypothetical protein [Actinomycetota bacterium]
MPSPPVGATPAGDPLERSCAMRILLAGATGVIGRQAVPGLSADLDTH